MEFPDLGAHCSEPSCKRLDFLPLKCDACEQLFCTDHVAYAHHNCTSAYKKGVGGRSREAIGDRWRQLEF